MNPPPLYSLLFGHILLLCALVPACLSGFSQNLLTNMENRTIIACGSQFGLMVRHDGTVWGWGGDSHGQLAGLYNSPDGGWIDYPRRIPAILGAVSVAAGSRHSHVLKWDGSVWSFGANEDGQLGLGDTLDRHTPRQIPNLTARDIDAGFKFSVAILPNGRLVSWGQNDQGQLGIGSKSPGKVTLPVSVMTVTNAIRIACGMDHALALSSDGSVWAWGDNGGGQLGDDNIPIGADRASPILIPNLDGVMEIAAGEDFSMALRTNGTVWVWGKGESGRLGLGNQNNRLVPTMNSSLSNICQIRAGSRQGYALDRDGKMWVWGRNGNEDWYWGLGFCGSDYRLSPTVVSNPAKVLYIGKTGPKRYDELDFNDDDFTTFHTSACLDSSGTLKYWGARPLGSGMTFECTPVAYGAGLDWGYSRNWSSTKVHPGAYRRGSETNADFASFVIPLDFQTGQLLAPSGGIVTNLLPFFTNAPLAYHYNETNSGANGQTHLPLRIPTQNPIVAFGSRVGGSSLFAERSYRFVVFSGCPAITNDYPFLNQYSNALKIDVYSRATFALVGSTDVAIPHYLLTNNAWSTFLTNGLKQSVTAFGLTTTLSTREYPFAYGVTNNGVLELTHEARDVATNYIFVVKFKGQGANGWMSLSGSHTPTWTPLYSAEFIPAPPWNIRFLSQIHFEGKPLPPLYDGKSLDEILDTKLVVSNVVQVPQPVGTYTNLDQSPELRRHPTLDDFVQSMKHDPMALARFVQNEIDLTDAIDPLGTNQIMKGMVRLGGVNRSALATFLERQGSPVEQCALLVYLMRQAGIPSVYAFTTNGGMGMLDRRLSRMLRVQLKGAYDPFTQQSNSYEYIAVNYPWVAAYIDNRWVHLFPWIKDTEIIEGPNLYDFMPPEYDTPMEWVIGYIQNRAEVISFGGPADAPETLFPRFARQYLATNAPGISYDEMGVRCVNRRKAYNSWDEFPTPTILAPTNRIAESLSDSILTSPTFTSWNPFLFPSGHIFNTVQIEVLRFGTNIMNTSGLRTCDIHNRPLLLVHDRATSDPDSNLRLKLYLAPYRSGVTVTNSFTNGSIVNAQVLTFPNPGTDVSVKVTLNRYRVLDNPDTVSRTMKISRGDLNALCLNFGRVSKEMLEPLARNVWEMERQIKATPSITNKLAVEQYHGPLTYLMGMAYYEKCNRFLPELARIHRRTPVATVAIGSARLIAKVQQNGNLPDGPMIYVQPSVDMFFNQRYTALCPTSRPDSPEEVNFGNDGFNLLSIVDASAKEHEIINSFYQQADAISTVRLLQLASRRNSTNSNKKPILLVNQGNVRLVETNSFFGGYSPNRIDSAIWDRVIEGVIGSSESQAFVTPGSIASDGGDYTGTGALIIDRNGTYSALISGNANGGWGAYIPDTSLMAGNLWNVSLNVNWAGNYSVNYSTPSSTYHPFAYETFNASQTWSVYQHSLAGGYTYTPFQNQWAFQAAGYLNVGGSGFNQTYANSTFFGESRSFLGWVGDALKQAWSAVSDPVHAVSGEFYVDTVDLTLVGPLPLEVRRNYSSHNTADNQFGFGWKMAFTPYISVTTNGTVMYAAEPDGCVLAYEPTSTNNNLWVPTLLRNPSLVNYRTEGVGSTANLLLSRIERKEEATKTNFYLLSPNGDVRRYQLLAFPIDLGTNFLERSRPYLAEWRDSRSNSLIFTYGTNELATDFGELIRVDSSSGGYLQFRYDVYGHIVEAFSGDGRHLQYRYDDFGDLVKVTLPDASEIAYEYQHSTQSVTNSGKVTEEPYSMHLLSYELKPEGRMLRNVYDSQRRVTIQAATVGSDLNLVTNAQFIYNNNFVLTNSFTNGITGHTLITDVFNKVTRYDYTNSRITKITDPLSQTITQQWYDENPSQPGYYPRSIWKKQDKRGLWTEYRYDQFGNVTNTIVTGALTNGVGTQVSSSRTAYNTNQLAITMIDALGNSNAIHYDASFKFLPSRVISYKSAQPMVTNAMFYGSVTSVVPAGNRTWTNRAFGMLLREVRAFGSPDAATNEYRYNGGGFITNEIRYTSTTDPHVTNWLFYNARGELFKKVDAAGRTYRFEHDGLGRVIAEETYEPGAGVPLGWEYSYYNHNGEKTWSDGPQYDPEDYVWMDYDGAGRKIVEVRWRSWATPGGLVEAESGDELYSITTYQYDAFGNLIRETDPVGNYVVMQYDAIGQLTRKVFHDASGNALSTNSVAYEPGGEIKFSTNALGGVTEVLHTIAGKPYFRKNADGTTNGWNYDLIGRPVREYEPNGSYWQTTYLDSARQLGRQFKLGTGAVLVSITNMFDRRGNTTTNIDAAGAVFFSTFDALDRVKIAGGPPETALSGQQVSTNFYDAAGIWTTNRNRIGRIAVTATDALQRPVLEEIRDAGNALVRSKRYLYSHDKHYVEEQIGTSAGSLQILTNRTSLDSNGRVVATVRFLGPNNSQFNSAYVARTVFDAAGRTVAIFDEMGRETAITYDGLGRVKTKRLADGATVTHTYNGEGGLTSMSMPGGLTWSATYNLANQPTSERIFNGAQITRNITNIITAAGPWAGLVQQSVDLGRAVTNTFTYDLFRRVATNAAGGKVPEHTLVTVFDYDKRGGVTNYAQTSGVNPATTVKRWPDGYSQATNEIVSLAGNTLSQFIQLWDAGGRRGVLQQAGAGYGGGFGYGYRVDNTMWAVQPAGFDLFQYGYEDNGLLFLRTNNWRFQRVLSRMWNGAPHVQATWLTGQAQAKFEEVLNYWPDGKLYTYGAARDGI
ncbi:MAG TPA: DUF6531 domain-containing protein, partial [Verrucomicrobiae bacterium]|nr:DUF6531 domain-containing protein [Verrucomicrobiae bacterium]